MYVNLSRFKVKPYTFSEWVDWFEKKSGEKFYLPPGYNLEFDEENGFMLWRKDGEIFDINQTAGNGKQWFKWAYAKAQELGCNKAQTWIRRNPVAYTRCMGGKVIDSLENEQTVYLVEWEVEL